MTTTANAYNLIDWNIVKAELGHEDAVTGDDDIITRCTNAATDFIESWCRRRLLKRSTAVVEYHDGNGGSVLSPLQFPIETAADIVSIYDDPYRAFGADSLIAATDYYLHQDGRDICLSEWSGPGVFRIGRQSVKLTYKPGFTAAPSDLARACLMVAIDFYHLTDKQKQIIAAQSMEGQSISYRDYRIHPTAEEILKQYKRRSC
jgi:hypothetical protein